MKKKFNFKKFGKSLIDVTLYGLIAYFGIKIVIILAITPILALNSAAYMIYIEKGINLFNKVGEFSKNWLIDLLLFSLLLLANKIHRNKNGK